MSETLGTIRGQLILDVKQALAAYTQARQAHISTVTALHTGAGAATQAGTIIAGVGVAMVAGFTAAIGAAAEFERKLDYFTAVSNTTQAEYDAIRQKALQLGADTIYSADQIADSFIELGKSGVKARDIIDGIGEGVAALGAAADIPLDTAANIITAAVATFQLGADQAVHVADQLAGAANSSIIEVQDLGLSLKYAGGIAASLKIPFEDVNAALAILGVNGIKGSTAGTSLRQILLGLAGTTPKATKALKELGIITEDGTNKFYDQNGSAKSLAEVFEILRQATKGMTDQQKLATLQQIFATRALPSLIALTNAGAEGFDAMLASISETTAFDVASQRLDNLSGDIEILRGNIDTLLISGGSGFQTFARFIVQNVTDVIQAFIDLPQWVQTSIISVIAIVGGILIAVGLLGIFAGAILNIIALVLQLTPVLTALSVGLRAVAGAIVAMNLALAVSPLAKVLIIVGLLIGALVALYASSESFRNAVQPLFTALQSLFQSLGPLITNVLGILGSFFTSLQGGATAGLVSIVTALAQFASLLSGVLAQALSVVVPPILTLVSALVTGLLPVFNAILPLLTTIATLFAAIFSGDLAAIPALITELAANFQTLIEAIALGLLPALIQVISQILIAIIGMIPQIIEAGVQLLTGLITAIAQVLPLIIGAVLTLVLMLVQTIVDLLPLLITAILGGLTALIESLATILPLLIQAGITLFTGLITALLGIIPILINTIVGLIPIVIALLTTSLPMIINAAITLFTGLITGILAVLPQLLTAILQALLSIVITLLEALPTIIEAAITLFLGIVIALVTVIPQILVALIEMIPQIITALIDALPALIEASITLFLGILTALITAIPQILEAVIGMIPQIVQALLDAGPQLVQAGVDLVYGLIDGIASMGTQLVNAVIAISEDAWEAMLDFFGIASPSKLFATAGVNLMLGLIKGAVNTQDQVVAAIVGIADAVANVPFEMGSLQNLYDTVAATKDLERELSLSSGSLGVDSTQNMILSGLTDELAELAGDTYIDVDVNNPTAEPASDSLPAAIRKSKFILED